MKVVLDTSCVVALLAPASEFHKRTYDSVEQLRGQGAEFVVTDHVLLESFSVLTRSPEPIKTVPAEAERLLHLNFDNAVIPSFAPGGAWSAIRQTISRGYHGGRVYDAAIALATYEAGARMLLTWNVRHFQSVAPAGLEVREP